MQSSKRATTPQRIERSPGIKKIAEKLGISIGTVDRALHDRPGIHPDTKKRVMAAAAELGYRPNLAARFLKSGKGLTIAVCLPRAIAHFFDDVRMGVHRAAEAHGAMVELIDYSFSRFEEGEAAAVEEALKKRVNGIILVPGRPSHARPLIGKASRCNIPVVCIGSDADGTGRLVHVATDSFSSGALVGEFLGCLNRPLRRLAVFIGSRGTSDHSEKLRGIQDSVPRHIRLKTTWEVIEAHDNAREAQHLSEKLLDTSRGLHAVYVATANSLPVLQAMDRRSLLGRIPVITTDIYPELLPYLRSGKVLATVYQHPVSQGRIAFDALHRFLVTGVRPAERILLPPLLVMRSNLDILLERSRGWSRRSQGAQRSPESVCLKG